MCFFDQHRFACGDWKWGHFRQHCAKEYRIGELCDRKLIVQTISLGRKCKLCQKIDTKTRRRAAETDRIVRWNKEPRKFAASIMKSREMIRHLDGEIYELSCERNRRLHGFGPSSINSTSSKKSNHDNQTEPSSQTAEHDASNLPSKRGTANIDEQFRLVTKKDSFLGLPMTFESQTGPATVMAIPDSGSDYNVICLELAQHLRLRISYDRTDQRINLLDGGTVAIVGTVSCFCRFGKTFYSEPKRLFCVFHVLQSVISPLIMSASFLEETETMVKYRQRLVIRSISASIPRVCALGPTRKRVFCSINGQNIEVLADSGSDIDIMSLDFVLEKGWKMEETEQEVVLADGRTIPVCGICIAQLSIGKDAKILPIESEQDLSDHQENATKTGTMRKRQNDEFGEPTMVDPEASRFRHVIQSKFYILSGTQVDALIGAASVEALEVFSHHANDLFTISKEAPGLHRISLAQKARRYASRLISESINTPATGRRRTLQEQLNHADQRENARREATSAQSITLTGDAKIRFDEEEEARR